MSVGVWYWVWWGFDMVWLCPDHHCCHSYRNKEKFKFSSKCFYVVVCHSINPNLPIRHWKWLNSKMVYVIHHFWVDLGGLTVVCQTKGFFSALTNSIVYQSFWWSHKNMQIQVPLWDYSGGQIELHYGIKLLFTSTPPAKTVFDLTNQLIATIYLLQSLLIHLLKHFLYFSMSKWTKGFSSVPFQFSLD